LGEGLLDQLESRVREVLTNGQDVKTYVELWGDGFVGVEGGS
jgi:hypothetical protein